MTVPPGLLIFARELRTQQTDAENMLWQLLRGRQLCGFKFRRQHPVAGYILDFYCREAAFAIELDGGGHNETDQRIYDDERTCILETVGIKVVRFWNHDVFNATEDVLEEIYVHLLEKKLKN